MAKMTLSETMRKYLLMELEQLNGEYTYYKNPEYFLKLKYVMRLNKVITSWEEDNG